MSRTTLRWVVVGRQSEEVTGGQREGGTGEGVGNERSTATLVVILQSGVTDDPPTLGKPTRYDIPPTFLW